MKQQLKKAEETLDNMKGVRGFAGVISSVYDTGVSVDVLNLLETLGISTASDLGLTGEIADIYDATNKNTATWLSQFEKSLKQAKDRFSEISGLISAISNTPEQKDVLELQARINAEEVMLQNKIAKLSMMKSQLEANERVNQQRIQQMLMESSGNLPGISW